MKYYRCGYCGHPTDEEGNLLSTDVLNQEENEYVADVYGNGCCGYGQDTTPHRVTRDMAIDACDPALEGEIF